MPEVYPNLSASYLPGSLPRTKHNQGYWLITINGKQVLEHRHVMSVHLGRELLPTEQIHHIDRDRGNNALSNLQLFQSDSEHISVGHKRGSPGSPKKQFICEWCKSDFQSYAPARRFCSKSCRAKNQFRTAPIEVVLAKGGYVNKNGYRVFKVNGKAILEHRYIMEQHLGRKLKSTEQVHHIDRNKLNNCISNLLLCPSGSHHSKLHSGHFASETYKQCCDCKAIFPRAKFPLAKNPTGHMEKNRGRCRQCENTYAAQSRRKRNPNLPMYQARTVQLLATTCPACGSCEDQHPVGHGRGRRRVKCRGCGRCYTLNTPHSGHSIETRLQARRLRSEGQIYRVIAEQLGVARRTVMTWCLAKDINHPTKS